MPTSSGPKRCRFDRADAVIYFALLRQVLVEMHRSSGAAGRVALPAAVGQDPSLDVFFVSFQHPISALAAFATCLARFATAD